MEALLKNPGIALRRPLAMRAIGYWALTLIIAWEMVAGSVWDLLQIDYVRGILVQLGYPLYLLIILGAWKLPCAIALLAPHFPRLKEWAYAGAFFNYSGAAASHLLVGDGAARWAPPLIFALITLGSWALRPPDRRLARPASSASLKITAWLVQVGLLVFMLVVALLTLPKGPPPG